MLLLLLQVLLQVLLLLQVLVLVREVRVISAVEGRMQARRCRIARRVGVGAQRVAKGQIQAGKWRGRLKFAALATAATVAVAAAIAACEISTSTVSTLSQGGRWPRMIRAVHDERTAGVETFAFHLSMDTCVCIFQEKRRG